MNRSINIELKYILPFAIAFLVLLYFVFFTGTNVPNDVIEITKTTTTETVKKEDSISVDLSAKVPKQTIAYLVDSITKSIRKKPTAKETANPKKASEKEVQAKVYKETFYLDNAKVEATILSPDRIFGVDLKVFTNDQIITNTIATKITKYVVPNVWFINYEPNFSVLQQQILAHEISLDYTLKGKFRVGAGLGYNLGLPLNNKFYTTLKIGIKL